MTLPSKRVRADDAPADFDEVIRGEAMTSAERAQTICDELEREFNYALRHDVELLIDLARAASEAHEQAGRYQEEERAALDPASDPEDAARMRRAIARRRRAKVAADAMSPLRVEDSSQAVRGSSGM